MSIVGEDFCLLSWGRDSPIVPLHLQEKMHGPQGKCRQGEKTNLATSDLAGATT